MTVGTPFLMYHELSAPGRPLARSDPGYVRYVVSSETFREQLERLRTLRIGVRTVGQALPNLTSGDVVLTFDDGCESDLLIAAPLLREYGFGATFYITVDHLGTAGFLRREQLQQLAALGFEIGSHALTHSYLDRLDDQRLRAELVESKQQLKTLTGAPVRHLSCPGGRWSPRVARMARAAGYDSVATSVPTMNRRSDQVFRLGRFAITRGTSAADFERVLSGQASRWQAVRNAMLDSAKAVLGDAAYERARNLFLNRPAP